MPAQITITLLTTRRTRQTVQDLDVSIGVAPDGYTVVAGENLSTEVQVNYPEAYRALNCYVHMKNSRGEYVTITFEGDASAKTFTIPSTMTLAGNTVFTFYAENTESTEKTVWVPVIIPITATGVDYARVAQCNPDIVIEAIRRLNALDDAEAARVAAEEARRANETARVDAETARAAEWIAKKVQIDTEWSAKKAKIDTEWSAKKNTIDSEWESRKEDIDTGWSAKKSTIDSEWESRKEDIDTGWKTRKDAIDAFMEEAEEAEAGRVTAEAGRVSAESARVTAEAARASAETARDAAETTRASAETARAGSETQRASAETARASAETTRASAEAGRVSAETARAAAETGRVAAEDERVKEWAEKSAEMGRIIAIFDQSEMTLCYDDEGYPCYVDRDEDET